MTKKEYVKPAQEVLEVRIEKGFATSEGMTIMQFSDTDDNGNKHILI